MNYFIWHLSSFQLQHLCRFLCFAHRHLWLLHCYCFPLYKQIMCWKITNFLNFNLSFILWIQFEDFGKSGILINWAITCGKTCLKFFLFKMESNQTLNFVGMNVTSGAGVQQFAPNPPIPDRISFVSEVQVTRFF